jgi:hypothetical protein
MWVCLLDRKEKRVQKLTVFIKLHATFKKVMLPVSLKQGVPSHLLFTLCCKTVQFLICLLDRKRKDDIDYLPLHTCCCLTVQFFVCLLVGLGGAKTTFSTSTHPWAVDTLPGQNFQSKYVFIILRSRSLMLLHLAES